MKKLALLFFLSLFVACSGPGPIPTETSDIDQFEGVTLKDSRPDAAKTQKMFSANVHSEKYGIWRLKETASQPTAIRVLQHKLHEKFASAETALSIEVLHLVTYQNLSAELKRDAMGGPIGALTKKNDTSSNSRVITSEEFMVPKGSEFKRGQYTEAENPNKASVLITYIIAYVNGETIATRTLSPFKLEKGDKRRPYVVAINQSIDYFLSQL